MSKRIVLLAVLCALVGLNSGCRVIGYIIGSPLSPRSYCDPQRCGVGCAPACPGPPTYRWCPHGDQCHADPCDLFGGECGEACDPTAVCSGRRPCYRRWGPLAGLVWLFTGDTWCGRSCGERYWGEWFSDPVDCCDPCDQCGNFTGVRARGCVCDACDGSAGTRLGSETVVDSHARQPAARPLPNSREEPRLLGSGAEVVRAVPSHSRSTVAPAPRPPVSLRTSTPQGSNLR
jgi:hypothetical protein